MTSETIDTIEWTGVLTLLDGDRGRWQRQQEPLRLTRYRVTRRYRIDEATEPNATD